MSVVSRSLRISTAMDRLLPLVMVVSGISAAWSWLSSRTSLWEDEITSITHGLQQGWLFFSEILRNDIHQFVYYLLLKGWTSFCFESDAWALSSSMLLMVINAALLTAVVWREFGSREAVWTGSLFCAFPAFAWSAANLRMYALIPGLVVLAWWANRTALREAGWKPLAGVFLAELSIIGSHAIGFYFVFFLAVAGAMQGWTHSTRAVRTRWAWVQMMVGLIALPLALGSSMRGVPRHIESPDFWNLLGTGAQLMYPEGVLESSLPGILGMLMFPALVWLGCLQRDTRTVVIAVPVAALVAGIGVSALGKPMFKAPVYAAHLMPFLAMGAGVGLARLSHVTRPVVGIVVTLMVSMACWSWVKSTHIPENFKPAGEYLQKHAQPGDVVVAPSLSVFWGVLRYSGQPAWGEPLTVMPLQAKPVWTSIKRKLGPELSERIGFTPRTDTVEIRGIRYVIANEPSAHPATNGRVWVVHRMNYIEPVTLPTPGHIKAITWFGNELAITEVEPDREGTTVIHNPKL